MLQSVFPKLSDNRIVKAITRFLYTDWYLLIVVALMVVANLFGMEFPVYYCYMLFCVATALFADDLFPIMPMACTSYMTFSANNNPAANVDGHIFSSLGNIVQFVVICAIIVAALVTRLVFELKKGREKKAPAFSLGFLALGVAYMLGGLFSPYYEGKTVLFGLLQIVCLTVFYFFFYYTVDWGKRHIDDYAKLFTVIGVGLILETIGMYLQPEVLEAYANGRFERKLLLTGWGIYNNVGGMLVLCLPAPFYFAATKKQGWIFSLLGSVQLAAIVLTQSRSSIIFGLAVYAACVVTVLILSKKWDKIFNLITYLAIAAAVGISAIFFFDELQQLFRVLLSAGWNPSGRWSLYTLGWEQFLQFPVFGNGFYQCKGGWIWADLPQGAFLPARYHNTVVQLIASGGAVALIAYLFHRVQTAIVLVKRFSVQTLFIALSICGLLLTSMLDCHFFNLGPGLLYGCLLVMLEKGAIDKKPRDEQENLPKDEKSA